MKQFRRMAAALCAVFLLCGFVIPAYAYADGGEGTVWEHMTKILDFSAAQVGLTEFARACGPTGTTA